MAANRRQVTRYHGESSKVSPVTKLFLDNCKNFSIENNFPIGIHQEMSPEMAQLVELSKKFNSEFEKPMEILRNTIIECKSIKSQDPLCIDVRESMIRTCEVMLNMLENTTKTLDQSNKMECKTEFSMAFEKEASENKENIPPAESNNTTLMDDLHAALIQIDVVAIIELRKLVYNCDHWMAEAFLDAILNFQIERRVLMHMIYYPQTCKDPECPTCEGKGINIYEDENGQLSANGVDLVQDCIRMYLESKNDKPSAKVDLCESVFQYLYQLYPEVPGAYGKDALKSSIKENLDKRVLRKRKRSNQTSKTV